MTGYDLHAYACAYEHVCVCLSQIFVHECMYKKAINKEMHEVEKEQECYAGGFKVKKWRIK